MTVPHPRKDIEITLLKLIERHVGIKLRREVADLAVYPAYFEKGEGGDVVVSFPDLPGCCTQGGTEGEREGLTRSGFLAAAAREWLARL